MLLTKLNCIREANKSVKTKIVGIEKMSSFLAHLNLTYGMKHENKVSRNPSISSTISNCLPKA